jgi:hypothetical protein
VNPPDTSRILSDLLTRRPGEIFLDLPVHDAVFGGIVLPDDDAYHGESVFFARNISYCCMVVMGPGAILAPGNYSTTYRLKVPDNQSHVPFAKLFIVDSANTTHWRVLTEQFLTPSDFHHVDQYQNFTLPFTLSEFATSVEFLVDYYRGPTDLYADYIVTTREERDGMPNFASIVVGFGFPDRSELYTVQLAEAIREQGGIVIHPDEFSAALNPEFMLEWAIPILGANHPRLAQAHTQLASGDYFASLLSIRRALQTLPTRRFPVTVTERNVPYTVTITANTWLAPLEYDGTGHQIQLSTHGPPEGTVQAHVTLPNDLMDGFSLVKVDHQPHPFTRTQNATHTTVSLEFEQGPHDVEVPLPMFAPPTIISVTQTPSTEVLPGDAVHINATVTDPNGVHRVVLNYTYTTPSGPVTVLVNMTHLGGPVWTATIPLLPYHTNVTYRIVAEDALLNVVTTEALGYAYHYLVIPEFPRILLLSLVLSVLAAAMLGIDARAKAR